MFIEERSDVVGCLESVRESIDYLGGLVDHMCRMYDIGINIITKAIEHGYHNFIGILRVC